VRRGPGPHHAAALLRDPELVRGAEVRMEGGRIELVARADDGVLEISLRDDGPGSADYAPRSGGGHGVGLANTRERLRVLYGENQSFTIRTCEPHGTLVTLRLPLERLEEATLADAHAYADR